VREAQPFGVAHLNLDVLLSDTVYGRRSVALSRGTGPTSLTNFSYGDHAVALRADTDPVNVARAVEKARRALGSVVLSFRAQDRLPQVLLAAAAQALGASADAAVYVTGDATDLADDAMLPFRNVQKLNLNVQNLTNCDFLADFTALRTLIVQGSQRRPLSLGFLTALQALTTLTLPGAVAQANAIAKCARLRYLGCSSSKPVLEALTGHPALEFLDVTLGANRDLSALSTLPSLRGIGLYQVRGLTGNDLSPIGECQTLQSLSLGALRNVTQLSALRGQPRHTLQSLLMENQPNQEDL
jgi:hypothetical protein